MADISNIRLAAQKATSGGNTWKLTVTYDAIFSPFEIANFTYRDGFVVWERKYYERAVTEATAGLPAGEKLDAALRVIVEYQQSYPGLRMIDIEPAQVIRRLARVIPLMRDRLERLAQGPDASLAVATAVRVAVSHYLVRSDDDDQFLAQLRHAAGVKLAAT